MNQAEKCITRIDIMARTKENPERKDRSCLRCGSTFNSESKYNKICKACKAEDSYKYGLSYKCGYYIVGGG